MCKLIQIFFLTKSLRIVIKKLAPSTVSLTGEKAKRNDFFSSSILFKNGKDIDLIVDGMDDQCIRGRRWNGEKYDEKSKVYFTDIANFTFHTKHYLGQYTFTYKSPLKLVVWEILKFPKLIMVRDKLRQLIYNFSTPERANRIELLQKIVELSISESAAIAPGERYRGTSSIDMLHKLYGDHIFRHPNFKNTKARFKLTLESLVESGDVTNDGILYRAADKALSTIAQYEQENRHHKDQMRHSSKIIWLTGALVLVGLIQAYIAWNTFK